MLLIKFYFHDRSFRYLCVHIWFFIFKTWIWEVFSSFKNLLNLIIEEVAIYPRTTAPELSPDGLDWKPGSENNFQLTENSKQWQQGIQEEIPDYLQNKAGLKVLHRA